MAEKLLIVHGYSDGYISQESCFRKLQDFLVENGAYKPENIHYVEYASMDDQSTFEDFADKLDTDYEKKIGSGMRVDILCHSTGALVTRVWLALRRQWLRERNLPVDNPVHRLFMFAPANFGSDLARMGESFLGKLRCTFFNRNAFKDDWWESGRVVLQGLEPASPFQWELSMMDLHTETYLGPEDESGEVCYPFIFAAAEGYKGLESKILKARNKPGTDGTVRICGTNLNTRKCTLRSTDNVTEMVWQKEKKHPRIPFAVFQGFNHGSIINPEDSGFLSSVGPGTALLQALKVDSAEEYAGVEEQFTGFSEQNYAIADGETKDRYQQFFIKVRDDAGFKCEDYFIDFCVQAKDPAQMKKMNGEIDKILESRVTVHSQDPSMRVFLVNLTELNEFMKCIKAAKARIELNITARRPNSAVSYESTTFVVHDAGMPFAGQPVFLYQNTTTLIEIILNRMQSDKVLNVRSSSQITNAKQEGKK
jgi:hypothetical protein